VTMGRALGDRLAATLVTLFVAFKLPKVAAEAVPAPLNTTAD